MHDQLGPDPAKLLMQGTGEWALRGLAVVFVEKVPAKSKVPNVIGWGLRDAVYILESRGLKVRVQGYGKVNTQSIPSGSQIIKGSTILIRLKP